MSKATGRPILAHLSKLSSTASPSRKPSVMLCLLHLVFQFWIKSLPSVSPALPVWRCISIAAFIIPDCDTSHHTVRSFGMRGESSLTAYSQYLAKDLACRRCSINFVTRIKGRKKEGKEGRGGERTPWEPYNFLFEIYLIITCPTLVQRWQLK